MNNQKTKKGMDRRSFLRSTAAVGAGLVLADKSFGSETSSKADGINVALLGAGKQGQALMNVCLKMGRNSGIRFKALCDIWQFNQEKALRRLKAYDHQPNAYVDYREMLDKERDLDAVIIATPLFCHAEQTIACLKAGLHVYCEKEMSNTVEGARKMTQAAKETGKLLQIGRQRRSNSQYIHCYDKLLKEAEILGRITAVSGQWNRSVRPDLGAPKKYAIDQKTLEKYGYKSMHQFRNWKWYKGLGAGYIVELGSHQIDVFNWFLDTIPRSVVASGGIDYYDKETHQWYDNVMAVYEYEIGQRTVRAFYQMITTNSSQGYFTKFMGNEGTLVISLESGKSGIYREEWVPESKWQQWIQKGYVEKKTAAPHPAADDAALGIRPSVPPTEYGLPAKKDTSSLRPHLENFFDAIRGKAKLTCPAEIAYKSAVSILKVNEAVATGKKINFKPEDFKVCES
jgi:predicted dehydrogenase